MMDPHDPKLSPEELREAARDRLGPGPTDVSGWTGADTQSLVAELELHQEELRIQNEALQQARDRLEIARDRYRNLFEQAPVGYLILDGEGRIREANRAAVDLLAPGTDPAGRLLSAFVAPESQDALHLHQRALAAEGASHEVDELKLAGEGTTPRTVLIDTVTEPAADAGAARFRSALADITTRKRAEQALAKREQQLLEAQALASLGRWTMDLVTGEVFWSDEVYRIFDRDPEHFTPTLGGFYAAVHPDDLGRVEEQERQAEEGHSVDLVHRIVRPDGSVRHVRQLKKRHTDATGKPLRLTGTVQDVTERIEFQQALIAAREEAEAANQAKSEFLSSMSHELRTPMNAILGFGQLMDLDECLEAKQRENVAEVLKAATHLMALIDDVLNLSRIESGSSDISLAPVDVWSVVEECLSMVKTMAAKRGIRIRSHGLEAAIVRADRIRLKQALLNLLTNAIKYNQEGGSVHLEVETIESDRLRILVRDSGPGIPAEKKSELFEPFNRLGAENSAIEGTGIGLTLTRRIVEIMGGEVDFESELGKGSTFWIELPSETSRKDVFDRSPFDRSQGAASDSSAGVKPAPDRSVLYIEDNPANLKLVARILRRMPNIHLLTAYTPKLGIELARNHSPALILLDINLPGMDGYQVLKLFQNEPELQNIPVIAVTANAMPRDIERGKAAGFTDYLVKPLNVDQFLSAVKRSLGQEPA